MSFRIALIVLVVALASAAAAVAPLHGHAADGCSYSWAVVDSAGAARAGLRAVAARSPYDVWAVGAGFAEHWNGARWKATPVRARTDYLRDVAVASNGEAWVVSSIGRAGLIEHWDGRAWLRVPLTATTARADDRGLGAGATRELDAVSAGAGNDVWAVGTDYRRYTKAQQIHAVSVKPDHKGVILHWDGRTWTRPRVPAPALLERAFTDVVVAPSGDVWVVGRSSNTGDGIALRWQGEKWQTFRLPAPAGSEGVWDMSVAAAGDSAVVAVGTAPSGPNHLMGVSWGVIYRWNGRQWARRIPNYFETWEEFDAVATPSERETWIADNDTDPFRFANGTQLFTALHPQRALRTQLAKGLIINDLAYDGRETWAVGATETGSADPYDYSYARSKPLIERSVCGPGAARTTSH